MKSIIDYCKCLELKTIVEMMSKQFFCKENVEFILNPTYLKDKDEYKQNIENLNRMRDFIYKKRRINFVNYNNLNDIFIKIYKNICLSIEEFVSLIPFFESVENVINDFKEFPLTNGIDLDEKVLDLKSFSNIYLRLNHSFTYDKEVNSDASSELARIRKQILNKKSSINKIYNNLKTKYKDYLSDENSFKDGYQTLAVKSNCINKIDGIVLSTSHTKLTLFVVPKEIVSVENELASLYNDEEEEINRILIELTNELNKNYKFIYKNYQILLFLDKYHGLVQFSLDNDFTIPIYSEDKLELNSLIHPLIDRAKLVKNNFALSKDTKRTFVLSGPNAGGKSVLFKEIGLVCVLSKLGLVINCQKESYVPYFNNIFLVLSEEESILDNLSKFTFHLKKLNNILLKVDENSIVIVDEICSGTSPTHGEAIAISFLNEYKKKNPFILISTHYDGIKRYGISDSQTLNASMEFDVEKLTPTYKLLLNKSGSSYAIEACYKVKVDENVIKNAKQILLDNQSEVEHLEYKLSKELNKYSTLNNELEEKNIALNKLVEKKEREIKHLEDMQEKFDEDYEEKLDKVISEKEELLTDLFKNRVKNIDFKTYSEIKGQINKLKKNNTELVNKNLIKKSDINLQKSKEEHEFKLNDYVIYNGIYNCKIIKLKNNNVTLLVNGCKIQTTLDNIKYDKNNSNQTIKVATPQYTGTDLNLILNASFKNELNIIGQTSDIAMSNVKQFLSDCQLRHIKQCRVIHGNGNFILRRALIKLLDKLPEIDSYRDGLENEGGMGATVIYLK